MDVPEGNNASISAQRQLVDEVELVERMSELRPVLPRVHDLEKSLEQIAHQEEEGQTQVLQAGSFVLIYCFQLVQWLIFTLFSKLV